jgi:hypothetical protein
MNKFDGCDKAERGYAREKKKETKAAQEKELKRLRAIAIKQKASPKKMEWIKKRLAILEQLITGIGPPPEPKMPKMEDLPKEWQIPKDWKPPKNMPKDAMLAGPGLAALAQGTQFPGGMMGGMPMGGMMGGMPMGGAGRPPVPGASAKAREAKNAMKDEA